MIIESLLDTDLYKFTMMQCVLHQFPGAEVSYRFRCRTPGVDLSPYADEIRDEVMHLCTLTFKDAELAYLGGLRFIKSDFVDFLSLFHLKDKYIRVTKDPACDFGLSIEITGPWLHTILFEIPILAIVNEVYFRHIAPVPDEAEGMRRLRAKIALLKNEPDNADLRVSDFGTRRRFSRAWQEKVVRVLIDELGSPIFSGTSNVDLARRYGLVSIGTMAHEYLQACQALGRAFVTARSSALRCGPKSTAGTWALRFLTSTGLNPSSKTSICTSASSLTGQGTIRATPLSGASGMIEHYRANKCDPRGKSLVFSDGLTVPRIIELYRRFHRRIGIGFGIGTNLMNDLGPQPLNIVVKMVRANGQPVAKISDNPVKGMCDDPTYLAYLRQVFGMPDKSVP